MPEKPSLFQAIPTTGNATAELWPILFYDFNRPPRKSGLYWVATTRWTLWPLAIGDRVLFGCASDEVEAFGHIQSFDGLGALVKFDRWAE